MLSSALMPLARPQLEHCIDAAMGRIPSDLVIQNAHFLDVFSCTWRKGDIAISKGMIVGIESGLKGKRTINASGMTLAPGFIDAHVHVESSLLTPDNFQSAVLSKGTTTAICDPHELANVVGVDGIQYFLDSANLLAMDLRVMLSSCVPATHFETNGGGHISAEKLLPLMSHPKALGLAEMMNVPGILFKDPDILNKIEAFSNYPIDGHCPLVSGKELSAYACAGISSCHESSLLKEAAEKLQKGIAVWIREGSVAKDLKTLIPLLNLATSTSMGFCTDDRNPLDIAHQGHLDYLLRETLHAGIPAEVVYRTASWSIARHYGLKRKGAIAPGYQADLVLLDDVATCSIRDVFRLGTPVTEIEHPKLQSASVKNTVRALIPEEKDLEGPSGSVHVICIQPGKIITGREVLQHNAPGIARLTVLERYGNQSKPSNGYVKGFGENFKGAIASSVGHDSHNLIVAGTQTKDMKIALAALQASGGGLCVVQNGNVLAQLALPFGGLMTDENPESVTKSLKILRSASKATGCELDEPFLQLGFLSLPVIPSLKLTDQGLIDVNRFEMIAVRAS